MLKQFQHDRNRKVILNLFQDLKRKSKKCCIDVPKQDGRLSLSCTNHAQNDIAFQIGTNICHPEGGARRISKKNDKGILRYAQNNRKCAFTLAEILITLGVIGIVAAMTLPALINKAQKMILKNQFKKTYSTLTQVINKSVADLGFVPACNYTINGDPSSVSGVKGNPDLSDCIVLNETFLKNLNIIQKCKGNGYQKGCIPKYKGFEEIQKENNPDLSDDEALEAIQGYNGFSSSNILNRNEIFVLADGNILISYHSSFQSNIFAFDINGKKGPNKWGYDVFSFWLGNTGKSGLILLGGTYSVEKGGKTTRQMIKDLYDDRK